MEENEAVMNSIVKKIQDFENEFIHLKIFNILTNNGRLRNFSHNRNGVFFELNTIDFAKLQEIDKKLSYYRITNDNVKENNKNREKLVDTMKKTVSYLPREDGENTRVEDDYCEEEEELVVVKPYNDDGDDDEMSECSVLSDSELFGSSSDMDQ